MPDNATTRAITSSAANNKTRLVDESGTRHGKFDCRSIRDGVEESEKGDFVRCETRVRVRRCADLRDADGSTGEGRKN